MAKERGIETMTTSEARIPSGSSVTSTSKIAMTKSRLKPPSRSATFGLIEAPFEDDVARQTLAQLGQLGVDAVADEEDVLPILAVTVTKTARLPL